LLPKYNIFILQYLQFIITKKKEKEKGQKKKKEKSLQKRNNLSA